MEKVVLFVYGIRGVWTKKGQEPRFVSFLRCAVQAILRKDRDSNPGTALDGHTLSRRASSATRASFLIGVQIYK